jgi:VPDSG-CTERM motif
MKNHMKTLASIVRQRELTVVAALTLIAGTANVARADVIPYPNAGTYNPTIYTFKAAASGNIEAYFSGSDAGYVSVVGMLVNGVSTGITGLNTSTATVGDHINLGSVNAGDVLTFELINQTLGVTAFSDPTLNGPYDALFGGSGPGKNHIYSTAYTRTSNIIGVDHGSPDSKLNIPLSANIPIGTYVGFDDQPVPGNSTTFPDYDYNDESFIFTDVATTTKTVPDSGSSLTLLGIGFVGIGLLRRRLCA